MAEELPPRVVSVDSDSGMRRLREFVSAGIAIIIMLGTLIMMIQAFNHLSIPEEFARVKDLLLFINPLLGVVIGYYFNKVTSEARAETAETTAKTAFATAQQAAEARNQAEAEAKEAKQKAEETKEALKDMGQAAEKLMAQSAPAVGVLGLEDETTGPVEDPRLELRLAWGRAQRLLQ